MKKILAILLAALLLIGVFAGCAKQEAKTPVQPEQSTPLKRPRSQDGRGARRGNPGRGKSRRQI